jgi:hypothetical protein
VTVFLLGSLVLSIVLTVLLNVFLRLFPSTTRRIGERLEQTFERQPSPVEEPGTRVRVYFPWRFMLLASLVLTILLNLYFRSR